MHSFLSRLDVSDHTCAITWKSFNGTCTVQNIDPDLKAERVYCVNGSALPLAPCTKLWKQLFGNRGRVIPVAAVSALEAKQMHQLNESCVPTSADLTIEQKTFLQLRLFPFCVQNQTTSVWRWMELNVANIANKVACYVCCQTDGREKIVAVSVMAHQQPIKTMNSGTECALLDFVSKHCQKYAVSFCNVPNMYQKLKLWKKKVKNLVCLPNSLLCKTMAHLVNETPQQFLAKCNREHLAESFLIICVLCKSFNPVLNRTWVNSNLIRLAAFKHEFVEANSFSFAHLCQPQSESQQKGGYIMKPESGACFNNCHVMDYTSFYLSLIVKHNICFSTYGIHPQAWLPSPTGTVQLGFVPEEWAHKGVLPIVVTRLMNLKSVAPNPIFKKLLSSVYGMLGTDLYFPNFKTAMWTIAEQGRKVILASQKIATNFGLDCVCIQTDSLFLVGASQKQCMQVAKQVQHTFGLHLKYETQYSKIHFGKSFYAGITKDNKLVTSGLFARNNASQWCRQVIQEVIWKCLDCKPALVTEFTSGLLKTYLQELSAWKPGLNDERFAVEVRYPHRLKTLFKFEVKVQQRCIDKTFYNQALVHYLQKLSEAFDCLRPSDIFQLTNIHDS